MSVQEMSSWMVFCTDEEDGCPNHALDVSIPGWSVSNWSPRYQIVASDVHTFTAEQLIEIGNSLRELGEQLVGKPNA